MEKKDHVTISDVAKRVGVSTTTISRYLNGKYGFMSEDSRARIASAIEEVGYRPSGLARALKFQKSRTLGLIVADITNPFSAILVKGVNDRCQELGYSLNIANTDEDPEREKAYVQSMIDQRVEGLIIHNTGENNLFFQKIATEQIPIVLAERPIGQPPILDTIKTNDMEAIHKVMKYIKKHGYERIGFFTEPLKNIETRIQRSAAYHNVYPELFNSEAEEYVLTSHEPEFVQRMLQSFLENSGRKSILTGNGVVTLNLLKAIKAMGLSYPYDLGICSFDDWEWMELADVTAITQPSYEISIECVNRLIELIDNKGKGVPKIREIPCKMVVRNSI